MVTLLGIGFGQFAAGHSDDLTWSNYQSFGRAAARRAQNVGCYIASLGPPYNLPFAFRQSGAMFTVVEMPKGPETRSV